MTDHLAINSWRLTNPHLDITVDEADPWAMPLVLRVERGVMITHEEALTGAAMAVVRMLADDRSAPGGEWHTALSTWMRGRIRKVTRRARASKWEAVVNSVPGLVVSYGNAEVFVGLPHPVDAVPEPLGRLQVSGLDLEHRNVGTVADAPVLTIAVNSALEMSTGKAMAQVGHAAQLALLTLEVNAVHEWASHFAVRVLTDAESFYQSPTDCVTVEDAGFTEIPAGSLTCKAWFA